MTHTKKAVDFFYLNNFEILEEKELAEIKGGFDTWIYNQARAHNGRGDGWILVGYFLKGMQKQYNIPKYFKGW